MVVEADATLYRSSLTRVTARLEYRLNAVEGKGGKREKRKSGDEQVTIPSPPGRASIRAVVPRTGKVRLGERPGFDEGRVAFG
jgi:hypothetical protein